jgi:hypothetical protein
MAACFNSWNSTGVVSLSAISQLSLSQSKAHLMSPQMEITPHNPGIMWDCHELGECQLSQESVVRSIKIGDLKLYSLHAEIFLSPDGYEKRNLIDRGYQNELTPREARGARS